MFYQLIVFYCAAFLASLAFGIAGNAVAKGLGIRVLRVQIGSGVLVRSGIWNFGVIPLNSYVRLAHSVHEPDGTELSRTFDHQPRLARAAVMLAGQAGMLLLAFALLDTDAWHSFVNAFGQIISGTLAPATRGAELLEGYMRMVDAEGPFTAIGVLAAKFAAFNLLPLPFLGSFAALTELLRPTARESDIADRPFWLESSFILHAGIWVLLAILAAWLFALYTVLTR